MVDRKENEMATSMFGFVADAGHGWLKVLRNEIDDLGIADKISQYSYMNPKTDEVYLEEDCDMPRFLKAYKEKYGDEIRLIETHTDYWWGREALPSFTA